jgi:WhiB family redox-sensing transcriptional regulator
MSRDWEEDARCRTVGIEIFFPQGRGGEYQSAARDAKAVCGHCTVRQICLETALQLEAGAEVVRRAGIWGGTTPRERHAIHRQRTAA